jgi:hypothetical protein
MTWLFWLTLAVIVAAVAAVTGIKPKGTRHVARTHLMGVARVALLAIVLIFAYMAIGPARADDAGSALRHRETRDHRLDVVGKANSADPVGRVELAGSHSAPVAAGDHRAVD